MGARNLIESVEAIRDYASSPEDVCIQPDLSAEYLEESRIIAA